MAGGVGLSRFSAGSVSADTSFSATGLPSAWSGGAFFAFGVARGLATGGRFLSLPSTGITSAVATALPPVGLGPGRLLSAG